MSRPFRLIIVILAVAVLVPMGVQYGRYAWSFHCSRGGLATGRVNLTAAGFTDDAKACARHPGRRLGRELELLETQMRVAGLFDESRMSGSDDGWSEEEWARLRPYHDQVLTRVEHAGRPERLCPSGKVRNLKSWPWWGAHHLLVVGGGRAYDAGDQEAAARSWGAALDLAWLQWTGTPNKISLLFAQQRDVLAIDAIRARLGGAKPSAELTRALRQRLAQPRWTRDDVHHAIRGEAAWLCGHFVDEMALRRMPAFDPARLGGNGLEEAQRLEVFVDEYCVIGAAQPDDLIALGERAETNPTPMLLASERARRDRALALAALLAHEQKEHVGVWPSIPEEIRDLDPEIAAGLSIERTAGGLRLFWNDEANLVSTAVPSSGWLLESAPRASTEGAH